MIDPKRNQWTTTQNDSKSRCNQTSKHLLSFFCLKLSGFFWTCGFLDQKKPKLPALRLPVFIIRKLRPVDEGTELEHQMEVHHVLRGKILLYCSCAWIIPGIVSSLIDGEYLPPFQGVWNAGWNMIWNMQWSLLPLESFIWRCCKLIVCQVWFISQISGQKPDNSIIRWSNYSTFGRVTCVFRCFSSSSSCKDFDVGILKGLERFGTQKSLALQVFFSNCSCINWWQHMWFGAQWFGILVVLYPLNPFHKDIPGVQATGPQTTN